jgi:hypothetical protein
MSDAEIIDLFDTTDITIAELARISGRSRWYVKTLLMGGS